MRKLVILRSVTGNAEAIAKRDYKIGKWFPNIAECLEALKAMDELPWLVITAGEHGQDFSFGPQFMRLGYLVETKSCF